MSKASEKKRQARKKANAKARNQNHNRENRRGRLSPVSEFSCLARNGLTKARTKKPTVQNVVNGSLGATEAGQKALEGLQYVDLSAVMGPSGRPVAYPPPQPAWRDSVSEEVTDAGEDGSEEEGA